MSKDGRRRRKEESKIVLGGGGNKKWKFYWEGLVSWLKKYFNNIENIKNAIFPSAFHFAFRSFVFSTLFYGIENTLQLHCERLRERYLRMLINFYHNEAINALFIHSLFSWCAFFIYDYKHSTYVIRWRDDNDIISIVCLLISS